MNANIDKQVSPERWDRAAAATDAEYTGQPGVVGASRGRI